MSKKFFIIFQQLGKLPPKLYKTIQSVQKYKAKQPEYTFREFDNQMTANDALMIYKMQHRSFKQNQGAVKVEEQSDKLKIYGKQQNGKKIQKSSIKKVVKPKSIVDDTNMIPVKTLEQLNKGKAQLINLTPNMTRLLHYHQPSPLIFPIDPSVIYKGYFDGCTKKNPGPSGAGYFIKGSKIVLQSCWPLGTKTNNQAQFLSLLYLLIDAYTNGIRRMSIFGDSKLVIDISNEKNRASHPNIIDYAEAVRQMLKLFDYKRLEHIERKYNMVADKLSNQGIRKKFTKEIDRNIY